MSRFVPMGCLCALLLLATACDEGVGDGGDVVVDTDAGPDAGGPGVCALSKCPRPAMGVACCTPSGSCGMDPTGTGAGCFPNPGDALTDRVCVLADCPLPTVGEACCTPFGNCGTDPSGTGAACFPNAPTDRRDAATPEPNCPPDVLEACPLPDNGYVCCTNRGECGVDLFDNGWCFPNPEPVDASIPEFDAALPDIDTMPPDDPSVTGECPSFAYPTGPVWGCCSDYGVCGTFASGACLLPLGTQIPVGPPPEEDAGVSEPFLRCTPPTDD